MKRTDDPRYTIAYLAFQEKTAQVETIHVSDRVNSDLAPDGTLYGIELLNANEQLRIETDPILRVVNEARGEASELPLAI
ncbi:MAG: DUF2283 domain-containing protein [Chloroflexota bacterium]|nr:DUF2283 domain-containing protein [Chloroflexota bacterium]